MTQKLAVIIPTFRERENLAIVVDRLQKLLADFRWEVIFVDDDSQDGSLEEFLRLSNQFPQVRFLRRIGRRGLSSACMEGMCSTNADILAVMDADLQHDESILPQMVRILLNDSSVDLVVGTRYSGDGGLGNWAKSRQMISKFATWIEKSLMRTSLSDPMSGFFALRRNVFESSSRRVTGKGFKILLDLVLSSPRPLNIREVSYTFRPREHGESKLDIIVGLEFLLLLAEKMFGHLIPIRFFLYTLVGLSGLILHLCVLGILFSFFSWPFTLAQWIATAVAMISNFLVNNTLTYRQQRLKGTALIPGAALYAIICSIGAIANVQVADFLFQTQIPWWFAGSVGAGIGAVWNYAVSSQIVWSWFRTLFASRKNS